MWFKLEFTNDTNIQLFEESILVRFTYKQTDRFAPLNHNNRIKTEYQSESLPHDIHGLVDDVGLVHTDDLARSCPCCKHGEYSCSTAHI